VSAAISAASIESCAVAPFASSAVSYSDAIRMRPDSRMISPPTVMTIATVIATAQL